jgi:hypothetical protein
MDVTYLFATSLGAVIWLVLYLARPDLRTIMRSMSVAGLPLALSDLFYVPQYWQPHTLGHVPIGIEGVLFSFEAAGICTVIYPVLFNQRYTPRRDSSAYFIGLRVVTPSWQHLLPLVVPMPIAFLLALGLHTNIEWGLYIGLIGGASVTVVLRRDLFRPMLLSGLSFTVIYTLALLIWVSAYPQVHSWFTLWHMPHWYLLGVPLEEILFGGLFALYWTGLYPMICEQRFTTRSGVVGAVGLAQQAR